MTIKVIGRWPVDSKNKIPNLERRIRKVKGVLHQGELLYIPEIVKTELFSRYHNNPLASHLEINKTWELIASNSYLLIFQADVEAYIKRWNIYLPSKVVKYKLYRDLYWLSN